MRGRQGGKDGEREGERRKRKKKEGENERALSLAHKINKFLESLTESTAQGRGTSSLQIPKQL